MCLGKVTSDKVRPKLSARSMRVNVMGDVFVDRSGAIESRNPIKIGYLVVGNEIDCLKVEFI